MKNYKKQFKISLQFIFDHTLAVICGLLTAYVVTCFSVFIEVNQKIANLGDYNKYVFMLICLLLFIKKGGNLTTIKAPGAIWFLIFVIYIASRMVVYDDEISRITVTIGKSYIIFLSVINICDSDDDYAIYGFWFILFMTIALLLYINQIGVENISRIQRRIMSEEFVEINSNTISYFAAMLFIIYCYIVRNKDTLIVSLFKAFYFVLASYIIILHASRGALIILAIATILRFASFKNLKTIFLSLFGIILFFLLIQDIMPDSRMLTDRIYNLEKLEQEKRQDLTSRAWQTFIEDPVWGKGPQYSYFGMHENHLEYLNFLIHFGIIGSIILLIGFFRTFPVSGLLSSRYSIILCQFTILFLLFANIITVVPFSLAFLYHEIKSTKGAELSLRKWKLRKLKMRLSHSPS
jgi:hypothetical protein